MKTRIRKLYDLLTRTEKQAFPLWLVAQKHQKIDHEQSGLVQLFHALKGKKSDEVIWLEINKDEPYNDSKLRKQYHLLSIQLEYYIAHQSFQKKPFQHGLTFMQALNQRISKQSSSDLFLSSIKKLKNQLKRQPLRNATYYQSLYKLALQQQEYDIKHGTKTRKKGELSIQQLQDICWFHDKLLSGLSSLNQQKIHQQQVKNLLLEEVVTEIKQHYQNEQYPLLTIYQQMYELLQGQAISADSILKTVKKNTLKLEQADRQNLFLLLLNYHIQQTNKQGDQQTYQQLWSCYEWALEESLILIDRILPIKQFKNIVVTRLRLFKYSQTPKTQLLDEGERFIKKWSKYIEAERADEGLRLAQGLLYFYSEKFRLAAELFNQGFRYPHFELAARMYNLQSRYELGHAEDLIDAIKGFKKLLQSVKEIPDKTLFVYQEQTQVLEEIIKTYERTALLELHRQLIKKKSIGDRIWLLEKLAAKIAMI